MDRFSRKPAALLCALALLLSLSAPALAAVFGDEVSESETAVHRQTRLSTNVFWSSYDSDFRTENYLLYLPNDAVHPVVHYGDYTTQMSTMTSTVRQLEGEGYRVVGGINGDFYNTGTGVPVGLILTEGQIRSDDAGLYAIGFRRDGSAILGKPRLAIEATFGYMTYDEGGYGTPVTRELAGINKARISDGGIYLFTHDFNRSRTTGNSELGLDAVCTILDGELAVGSSVRLRVDRVVETSRMTPVGENQMVLSVNYQSHDWWVSALRDMPGECEITISVSSPDPAWNEVYYGIGALYSLVENGRRSSGIPLTSSAPRTAIGQRPDGALIFYTLDGRKNGHSIGASLNLTADRLIELGCTTALCLDGGGSTTMAVTMPDSWTASTINTPSEGGERAVSSKIFLVAAGNPSGFPDHFYVRPEYDDVMAGSRVTVSATAIDTNFYPTSNHGEWFFQTSGGTLGNSVSGALGGTGNIILTTPREGGDITVTATDGGQLTGSAVIHAVRTPDELRILSGETALSSLTLAPGASVTLSPAAVYRHRSLYADPELFSWSAEGETGYISPEGVYTAVRAGEGAVILSAGDKQVSVPVSVVNIPALELESFETAPEGIATAADLVRAAGGEEVRFGLGAGELRYIRGNDAVWRYAQPKTIPAPYDTLSLWVRGDGAGYGLSLLIRGADGVETAIPVTALDFTDWRRNVIPVGGGAVLTGFTISPPEPGAELYGMTGPEFSEEDALSEEGDFTAEPLSGDPNGEEQAALFATEEPVWAAVWLDQITATYQGRLDDTPPEITAFLWEGTFYASIRDDMDEILPPDAVSVYFNGERIYDYTYYDSTGDMAYAVPTAGEIQEPSRLTVTARDASGNLSRASVDIPPSGNVNHFTDIDGCWAADYINFLYNRNIAVPYPDGTYHPYEVITRVEFAAMLALAMRVDWNAYAGVELPYADLDQIPDYAIPALKVLYAENVMRGAEGPDGRLYLMPYSGLTRAQASAMIGRSQQRGYVSQDELPFPDADTIPRYARSHIAVMAARGILEGYGDGTFRPQANISRGQMAKILYFLA